MNLEAQKNPIENNVTIVIRKPTGDLWNDNFFPSTDLFSLP